MKCIRGATTLKYNNEEEIILKSKELFEEIIKKNEIIEFYSIIVSVTKDITAYNPVTIIREEFGLKDVAFMCFQEAEFEKSMPFTIRILINCEAENKKFVYLHDAKNLRKDLEE